jgi:uncharacterized protein
VRTTLSDASIRSLADAAVVVAICFGWFIYASVDAVLAGFPVGSFSDAEFLSLMLYELALASLALIYLRLRGYDLKWLLPRPTAIGCIIGILLHVAVAIAAWPIYIFAGSADTASQPIGEMIAGSTYSMPMLVGMSIVNGWFEETFLTGYLLQGMLHMGAALSIGIVSLIRLAYHLYQGPLGAVSALVFGVVVGVYYWRTRDLWSVIVAHVYGDIAGFVMA